MTSQPHTDLRDLNRREAIQSLLGGAVAASVLAGQSACATKPPTDTLDLLAAGGARYIDENGAEIHIPPLLMKLRGNATTLSFMFGDCGDICPITGHQLDHLSQQSPGLKHIVVSTKPASDLSTGLLKQRLAEQGLTFGAGGNTTILYPTIDGTATPLTLMNSEELAADIQHRFDLITLGNKAEGHSGTVRLYDGEGKLLETATHSGEIVSKFSEQLDKQRQR